MGRVVADYLRWIGPDGHEAFLTGVITHADNDPFGTLYRNMKVTSFGRLAKFDYLKLLSRYRIVEMAPVSAYLDGATGPRSGVSLLFSGSHRTTASVPQLQRMLDDLEADLGVGMSVMEDALCNWQKEPLRFVHYKG
jgi:hypothetical protein